MAGENHRIATNEVTTIPQGIAGIGSLTGNAVDDKVFNGAGTQLDVQIGIEPKVWLFFPNTTPPQLLEVHSFNGSSWIKTKKAPDVAITGQTFVLVFANLKKWGFLNTGEGNAYLNGNSGNGVPVVPGQTEDCPPTTFTASAGYDFKDVVYVDATDTTVEIFEQR